MASVLSTVLVFILLAKLAASSNDTLIFNGFRQTDLMSVSGVAEITSDGVIQMTGGRNHTVGHAFYPLPITFKRSTDGKTFSFSTTFVFAIVSPYRYLSGHGIAFALTPTKELQTLPSQYLGLFDLSNVGDSDDHIIAVELDTIMNPEFNDINDNHVGIDINSLVSENSSSASYYDNKERVWKMVQLNSGEAIQVWIDYNSDDTQLDVAIAPLNVSKPDTSLVTLKLINASSIFLDEMYVGFFASTGSIPACHYILGWSFSLNKGAPQLDPSKLPPVPRPPKRELNVFAIALPPSAAILILLIFMAIVFLVGKQRRKKFAELLEDWELEYGPRRFSYKDLYSATKGFDETNLLGVGGFGRVYRGALPRSKIEIAVKKISHDSKQGMREFVSEIVSLGRLRHRNLVQLLGYCRRRGELLLVYEHLPNGSLDKFLFRRGDRPPPLNWSQRFRIIKGVAAGLLYLHEEWEQVVVHRDIKASNVLLDCELNPKLGDFGLARLYDHGSNPHTTHIVGTLGYIAPELSCTGKATTSTDVYAFGAFLLEVACGRRPTDLHDNATGLASDPKLGEEFVAEEMELVLKLGLLCSHPNAMARPSIKQAAQLLEGDASLMDSVSPDGLISSFSIQRYDESFDEFLVLNLSNSSNLHIEYSSPLISGRS
ncbi:hypothetical protein Cni_G18040 [Canna indica]|uniref:non-specific serine/threonine protein kinase n=1 Tax=Canna indica TaxID=4628 RepID=A0AAQ3KNN8_9LILI|nr:hypothetical protein Cni_G18040 [Canna indica]